MRPVIYFFIIFAILLVGCGAYGKKFMGLGNLNTNTAEVYVYRPSKFLGGGSAPTIFIDNEARYKLKNGGFVRFTLPPRAYKFELGSKSKLFGFLFEPNNNTIEWSVYLIPNERRFYRFDIEHEGISLAFEPITSDRVVEVSEETAINEMRELNSSM